MEAARNASGRERNEGRTRERSRFLRTSANQADFQPTIRPRNAADPAQPRRNSLVNPARRPSHFHGLVSRRSLHAAARIISMKNSTMGRMRWKVGSFRMEKEKNIFQGWLKGIGTVGKRIIRSWGKLRIHRDSDLSCDAFESVINCPWLEILSYCSIAASLVKKCTWIDVLFYFPANIAYLRRRKKWKEKIKKK